MPLKLDLSMYWLQLLVHGIGTDLKFLYSFTKAYMYEVYVVSKLNSKLVNQLFYS